MVMHLRRMETVIVTEYALVTGASRNIGRAIAARLKADGYSVVMLDRINPEDPSLGEFMQADLSDPSATAQALSWAVNGREITRLVNCAGVFRLGSLEEATVEEFDSIIAVNTRSYIQVTQAVLPVMKSRGFGRIVNIASRAALGIANHTAYAASKAAVVAMTKSWAVELASHGITSNVIAPGPIETDMAQVSFPSGSQAREDFIRTIPAGRFGSPEDIAHAASYFLDTRSAFVTGQVHFVCGGLSVGRALTT